MTPRARHVCGWSILARLCHCPHPALWTIALLGRRATARTVTCGAWTTSSTFSVPCCPVLLPSPEASHRRTLSPPPFLRQERLVGEPFFLAGWRAARRAWHWGHSGGGQQEGSSAEKKNLGAETKRTLVTFFKGSARRRSFPWGLSVPRQYPVPYSLEHPDTYCLLTVIYFWTSRLTLINPVPCTDTFWWFPPALLSASPPSGGETGNTLKCSGPSSGTANGWP